MSSIRKEGGIWAYYTRIGRRLIHRSLQTGDRRVALDRQKMLDVEFERSVWVDTQMKWEDFRRQYEDWARARKPHNSFKNEELALRRQTAVLAPAKLSDVTLQQAELFITEITRKDRDKGKPVSPAGANFYIRTLRSIFSLAVEWKMIGENPFKGVRKLAWDAPSPRILTRAEIARLFVSFKEHAPNYVPLIAFYLVTGMRRNEALELEWKDVNFESGVITVARAKGRRPRLIPMAPAARRILAGRKGEERPFGWYPSTINRIFRMVRKEAKLEDVTLHDLRRTFGTLLAQAGVSSLFIQNWMGHADPMVTREHYIGLPEETKRQLKSLKAILPAGV